MKLIKIKKTDSPEFHKNVDKIIDEAKDSFLEIIRSNKKAIDELRKHAGKIVDMKPEDDVDAPYKDKAVKEMLRNINMLLKHEKELRWL